MIEQLEILRRIAERGKALAEKQAGFYGNPKLLDLFIHMLDEIERTKKLVP